jgi:hypothetical protein
MLARTSTAVRTDCDHFETVPRSLDAQSKYRKGLSPLTEKRASTSDSPVKLRDL